MMVDTKYAKLYAIEGMYIDECNQVSVLCLVHIDIRQLHQKYNFILFVLVKTKLIECVAIYCLK